MQYTVICDSALAAAGWTRERNVNIDDWLHRLLHEGYKPVPAAVELLSNLGKLIIPLPSAPPKNPYVHDLIIDPMYCGSGERDRVEEWERVLCTDLFPIGYVDPGGTGLWLASSGLVYSGFGFGLYFLGNSVAQALERLITSDFDTLVLVVA